MTVAAVAPMLNEMRFVRAWCENVKTWADEAVVIDTGSTDGTVEVLQEYHVTLRHERIKGPFVWPEAQIRNAFTYLTRCDWLVYMDADELVGSEFIEELPDLLKARLPFIRFPQVPFWESADTIRVRTTRSLDEWRHWYPSGTKTKMYRRGSCWWRGGHAVNGCHPGLVYRDYGKWSQRLCRHSRSPFFHYHYAFPMKPNDLRAPVHAGNIIEPAVRPWRAGHPKEARLIEGLTIHKTEGM